MGDFGSTDITVDLCETSGIKVRRFSGIGRDEARNKLASSHGWNMAIEPWEIVLKGHNRIKNLEGSCSYASVLNNKILSKEIRFWVPEHRFSNHTFEIIDAQTSCESGVMLYSTGGRDQNEDLKMLEEWKQRHPMSSQPYYYQACIELSQGKMEQFLRTAEHFLFMESVPSMSTIMTRYYTAYVYLSHFKKVRPTLQNLNLCICEQPLMAEFWCLMGDVNYHLLQKFDDAISFYENAMILGSRRLKNDKWPMDLSKYKEYPQKMISSCTSIKNQFGIYYDNA